jgi:alkylmercury lyase
MDNPNRDIPRLAAEFAAAHPDLDPSMQRLALALLRLLSHGTPVRPGDLAERLGLTATDVASRLERLATVQPDASGRVVAYGGLTLEPTSPVLEVDGRRLYTWCALDTLFLPELLGRPARVRSTAPDTGETIALTVDASGVRDVSPAGAVLTLHDVAGFDPQDVVGTFCCYVHYFASAEAGRAWARRSAGAYVVSIAEGFEYGRLSNHARLGAALAEAGLTPRPARSPRHDHPSGPGARRG